MKLSHVAIFAVIFAGLLTGMVSIFSDGIRVYGGNETDILNDYPGISGVVSDYNETYTTFQGTSAQEGGSSNFFLNLDKMKAAITQLFNGFKYASIMVEPISESFGIPPWATMMLTSIILIGLTLLLVSAAIRWRLDHE